jgi:protein-L-isoaspartate(D-aspartate) O-methyltransferase
MVDFTLQRKNMVESQVRPSDITDRRIIRAMLDVAREKFCPAASAATAYMDLDVKVSPTRYLTATRVLAKLIQGLDVAETDHVLIVGAGTGYTSAIMARLAAKVTALEADAALAATLTQNLTELGLSNVLPATGPLASGHAAGAPYDAILVSDGSVGSHAGSAAAPPSTTASSATPAPQLCRASRRPQRSCFEYRQSLTTVIEP